MLRHRSRSLSPSLAFTVACQAALALAVAAMAAGCADDAPTASRLNPAVSLAKAPSSVTVTSTDPTYAFQGDSVLTVTVKGTGFAVGARTSFPINGDTTHVHELSTTFVSSTEVVSTIKVDGDAPVALYDVVVTLVGGKKGVGAEMFTVKSASSRPQPPIAIAMTIDDATATGPSRVHGDGLGEYVDGVQGMQAIIDDVGNLQVTPLNGEATTPAARSILLDFSAPVDPLNTYRPDVTGQTNFKIMTLGASPRIQDLAVSQSACYRLSFVFRNLSTRYESNFSSVYDPQAAFARITRTSLTTWAMASDAACGANPTWAAVRSMDLTRKNASFVYRGTFSLPFSIQFRKL